MSAHDTGCRCHPCVNAAAMAMKPDARDDGWILTFMGRRAWPLDPRPEDICIEDIAHALALTCRFTGHCREFYSVAQHSVLVSHYVADQGGDVALQLAALLHDASEAYLPEVARPIKHRLVVLRPDLSEAYLTVRDAEDDLLGAIAVALFGEADPYPPILDEFSHPSIKQADNAILMAEKRDLMPAGEHVWPIEVAVEWKDTILPWEPKHAERRFLAEFRRLRAALEVCA